MNENINQQINPDQSYANGLQLFPSAASTTYHVPVKKINVKAYMMISVGSIITGVGLTLLIFIITLISLKLQNAVALPEIINTIVYFISVLLRIVAFVGLVTFILSSIIFHFMLIYKMWAAIDDGQSWTSPGKAIGYLFIPFVGVFYAVWNFTKYPTEYNEYALRHGLNVPPMSSGIFFLYGIMSVIPFVGLLSPLILPLVLKQGFGAINNLAEAIDNPSVSNEQKQRNDMNIPQNPLPSWANG